MTTKKRQKHDVIHIRPKDGTKAKAEWLAARENRSLTNWVETIVERLYEKEGGPPIESTKKTDTPD